MARTITILLIVGLAGVAVGEPPADKSVPQQEAPRLTPEGAKEAVLAAMRTRTGPMKGFDVKDWERVPVERAEDGWYSFGGAFHLNPARARYTMILGRPGVGFWQYEGDFTRRDGKWVASSPRETAHGHAIPN